MKKIFSLLTTILLAGSLWGTAYISYNGNTQDASTTISGSNVANGSAGKISWTGSGCSYGSSRVNISANGYITFTAEAGYLITKIVITSGSSDSYYGTWTSSPSVTPTSSGGVTTFDGLSANSVRVTTSTAFRCTSNSDIKIYYTKNSNPEITVDTEEIAFGIKNIKNNDDAKTGSKTIKVTGANLTGAITPALSGTNADKFSFSPANLSSDAKNAELTLSYNISEAGSYSATMTLTSGTAEVAIPISLKVVDEVQVVDTFTIANTGVNTSSYTDFSAKGACTDAEYSGRCSKSAAIQLNTNSPIGIVSTFPDGLARKISIVWNSGTYDGRSVDVYGKNTAYEGPGDLFENEKKGTIIGSITKGSNTELDIDADYKYIGILAKGGVLKIDTIFVTWAPEEKDAVTISEVTGGTLTVRRKAVLDENRTVANGEGVAKGKLLVVTAAPDETHTGGTIAVTKTADGSDASSIFNAETGVITMPDYDITVNATFTPTYAFTINATNCTVAVTDATDPITRAAAGTDVMVTVTPADADYELTTFEFSDNVVNPDIDDNVAIFEMPASDVEITAVCSPIASAVTIDAPEHVTLSLLNGETPVASGSNVAAKTALTVSALSKNANKYRVSNLRAYKTGDDTKPVAITDGVLTMPNYPITVKVDEIELFAISVAVAVEGQEGAQGNVAKINNGTETLYRATADPNIDLVATRATGYQFVNWTISAEEAIIIADEEEATTTVGTVKADVTITANFKAVPELLVSATALNIGTFDLNDAVQDEDKKTFTIEGASLTAGDLTLTLADGIKDAFTVSPNSVAVNGTLAETTITVTPVTTKAGNYSGNLTISGGGLAEAKIVSLSSVVRQTYTVTWVVNGDDETYKQTSIEGAALTAAPDLASTTLAGKVFRGWTDAAIDGQTDTEPAWVTLTAMPAKDTTLYATYATAHSEDRLLSFKYKITTSDFPKSGYNANDGDREVEAVCTSDPTLKVEVEWTSYQICMNANKIQGKANQGKISNAAPWGKEIKDITFVSNSGFTATKTGAFFEIKAGSSTSTATSIEITFDSTVNTTAYSAYATDVYEVTVTIATPTNGTLDVKNGNNPIASGDKFAVGTVLTIVPMADTGYKLAKVTINGEKLNPVENVYSFTIGTTDVEIAATFDVETSLSNTAVESKAVKTIVNGQLLITRDGKTYNVLGTLVR